MDYSFEEMTAIHRQAVIDIFNYFIKHSYAAFPEKKVGLDFFDRFLEMSPGYPKMVVKASDGEIIGFGAMRPHHFADSFQRTAELSYFLLPTYTRRGIGTSLLQLFIREARQKGIDSLLANISSRNEESLSFHLKNGFRECGRFLRVGRKFGEDFDTVWMQKLVE